MKRTSLRAASLLLALCLIFTLLPIPQAKAAGLSLSQLKEKFPNGAYWNHVAGSDHGNGGYGHCGGSCNNPDGYTWSPCYSHNANAWAGLHDCNVFNGGLQCCGFARKLAYDAYGSYSTNWANHTGDAGSYMWNYLKPGDVLHYTGGNADPTYGHWVFVIGVSGNAITVAECNVYNAPCQIRWGNVIYKDSISPVRVCEAPYALDNTDVPVITWSNSLSTPSQTDAKLEIRANAPYSGNFGETGITVWDAVGRVVAQKTEAADSNATTYLNIWYNLTEETGAVLKPSHYYTYQFHVYFNGTCYTSGIGEFVTEPCTTHVSAPTDAVAPTCTSTGLTAGTHCSACNSTLIPGETVPALGHDWDSGTITTQPTIAEEGVKTYSCSRCSAKKTESVPAAGTCKGGSSCASRNFRDVAAPGDWSHDGIDFSIQRGLFNGTGADTFEPGTSMTRAMLVTVLWRYAGTPKAGKNIFSDVPNGTWYTDAVSWAAGKGIVDGVGNGRFDPDGKITREQLAAILFRYSTGTGADTSARGSFQGYSDGSHVSSWAQEALQWAVAEKLVSGIQSGSTLYLSPQGNATRAQVATILMRYIQSL